MEAMICTVERIITNEPSLVDWFQLFVSILTLYLAFRALSTWKKELIGKKKINLAMDIVEKVCTVEDCLSAIRNPISTAAEYDAIKQDIKKEYDAGEQPTIKEDKLYYLAPAYRIVKNWNTIQDFLSLKNQARLYWEKDILDLFNRVLHLIGTVRSASTMLYKGISEHNLILTLEYKIWENYAKDDSIKKEMHNIVDEFILNLEPLFSQQKSCWKRIQREASK